MTVHESSSSPGNVLVVGVDFVLYGGGPRDPFGAQHLLDLQEDGVAVLEERAGLRAERDAAELLFADDPRAERLPDGLVVGEAQDLACRWASGSSSVQACTASAESGETPYASARASTGWRGERLVSARMRLWAVSAQSVTTTWGSTPGS